MVTGSIQIKKGYYYAVINVKDHKGKRKQKWVASGIKAEKGNKRKAQEFLHKEINKWDINKGIIDDTDTADYFEKWLSIIEPKVRQNTYRGYCGNMRNHIIPYFRIHPVKLKDLTTVMLEDYYFSKLNNGSNLSNGAALSPQTIRHHHQNICKALNDAVKRNLIIRNPAQFAELPKLKPKQKTFLNPAQLKELSALFVGSPIEDAVNIKIIYGLRRSELLGLKWQALDFDKKCFTICETRQQGNHGDYTDAPKTAGSLRTLPMTEKAYEIFKSIQEKQSSMKKLLGSYYVDSDYIFTREDGAPITDNYFSKKFHDRVSKSNLPYITPHSLRHSFASNRLYEGFDVVHVQDWLGHSSSATTLNYYAHASTNSKQEIAEQLNKLDKLL